jgi:hypothetical protein
MIKTFWHEGLRCFFETCNTSGVQASHAKRLRMQLIALDTAKQLKIWISRGFAFTRSKVSYEGAGQLRSMATGVLRSSSRMKTFMYWATRTITDNYVQSSPPW